MAPSDDSEKLCAIISSLEGPSYSPSELGWAAESAAGKTLLQWIAAQLSSDGGELDEDLKPILTRIALEDDEVNALQKLKSPAKSSSDYDLSSYLLPSRQSARTAFLDNSAYTLETELVRLQKRIQQTKNISQQLSRSARTIKATLDRVDNDIGEKQHELAEVSLEVDSMASNTTFRAFEAIKALNTSKDPTSILTQCLEGRDHVTQGITEELANITAWQARVPSAAYIELQALRLQDSLATSDLRTSAEETAYRNHLHQFSVALEKIDDDEGEIYDILQEINAESSSSRQPDDILKELESAWNIDQRSSLNARAGVFDKALTRFRRTILPPLQELHEYLSKQRSVILEIVAVLESLEEEMQNIEKDLETVKCSSTRALPSNHSLLQNDLNVLLKQLKDLRPSNSPPLVLLDGNDIVSELTSLKQTEKALNVEEERLCSAISLALNSLDSMHDSAMSATYAHSMVNTSPPYQLSRDVTKLQREAQAKGDALTSEVQRLQQDIKVLDDPRTQRKLKSFVERWHPTSLKTNT